jgi:diacylglycerol kinase family enzyme
MGANSRRYAALSEFCVGKGEVYAPTTEVELEQACRKLRSRGSTRVVVVGGDGTWMRVLSELYRQSGEHALPTLALIPAGTVNLAAKHWELRGRSEALLAKALAPQGSPIVERDCLRVTLDERVYLAFTVGSGLVSRFFEVYEQQAKQGNGIAAQILLRTFVGSFVGSRFARRILSPVRAKLSVDSRELGTLELTLLVTSVFSELGLGLKPTYRATSTPGKVHLIATTLPVRKLGPKALRVWRGLPLVTSPRPPEVIDCMARDFQLQFDAPHPIVLDGDAVVATCVSVQPGPRLRVLSLR